MAHDRLSLRCKICGQEHVLATWQGYRCWLASHPSRVSIPSAEHMEAFLAAPKWDQCGDALDNLNSFFEHHRHTDDDTIGQHQFEVVYENPDLD